jgi:hypothetical protein
MRWFEGVALNLSLGIGSFCECFDQVVCLVGIVA